MDIILPSTLKKIKTVETVHWFICDSFNIPINRDEIGKELE
jgi:hypothetical protein